MTTIPSDYRDFLATHGSPGFSPGEIVDFGPRKELPPVHLRENIKRTLHVANVLRERMINRGARGLLCHAAFRPLGGALRSAHKRNYALDLDLINSDIERMHAQGVDLRAAYAEESVIMWCEIGAEYDLGLGHYGAEHSQRTLRVHIDTTKCRSWQHAGSHIVRPPSTVIIAKKLGLTLPTDHEVADDDT